MEVFKFTRQERASQTTATAYFSVKLYCFACLKARKSPFLTSRSARAATQQCSAAAACGSSSTLASPLRNSRCCRPCRRPELCFPPTASQARTRTWSPTGSALHLCSFAQKDLEIHFIDSLVQVNTQQLTAKCESHAQPLYIGKCCRISLHQHTHRDH